MLAPIVHKVVSVSHTLIGYLTFAPPLLTRLLVGFALVGTGGGKLGNLDGVSKYFETLHVPMPAANAWFVAHLEYYGGMLLVAGVLTRPIGALLAGTMLVATLTGEIDKFRSWWTGVKFEDGVKILENGMPVSSDWVFTDVTAFAYLIFLTWIVLYGPGKASLDFVLCKVLGIQTYEESLKKTFKQVSEANAVSAPIAPAVNVEPQKALA